LTVTAEALGIPPVFNAADYFIDRHLREGRAEQVAIVCGDTSVTYGELAEQVNRCGHALRGALGVRREERVLLLALDGPEFIYTFFGAIKIGAVPIPTNTLWKPADYCYALNDSRARVLVVSEPLLPQLLAIPKTDLKHLQNIVVIGTAAGARGSPSFNLIGFAELLADQPAALEAEDTSRDDVAFWLYSSGSTGNPKGCVHLQHDMVVCTELYAKGILGMTGQDRSFSAAKLFFAYGLGNGMYFPLGTGGTAILWPGPPTAANIYQVIERYRPTLFYSVPTGYGMMLAHEPGPGRPEFNLESLRQAVSAGEALPPALFERFKKRFGVEILDGIGSTEILHIFISNRPGDVRPGSSGRIVPGYDARVVDEHGTELAAGEIGNLMIGGDSTCSGYWNRHEKTKDTFSGCWIKTGDKYQVDADGFYWYAGRSDDMLKVGGIWVSPVEVENALLTHPEVQECAVVGREDRDGLVKPLAFVVLRTGVAASPVLATDLQSLAKERLAEYKRPRWVEFIPELPKTATGKIQRFRLRQS
jgi:benzoate-CoA ligase